MRKNQNGQALLIILLTMVVALTVVLSIIASSTSDIKLSTNETISQRAFSAAESGAEKALSANSVLSGTVNTGATYNASISSLALAQTFVYPAGIASNDSAVFWFVSHKSDGTLGCDAGSPCFTGNNISLCWATAGTAQHTELTPAIEASVYYLATPGDYSTARVAKAVYDPNDTRRNGSNGNSYSSDDPGGTCTISGNTFAFRKTFSFSSLGIPSSSYNSQNGLQFLSIKMLYNTATPQSLGLNASFAGNSNLPSQGHVVDSVGTLSNATRKVEVTRVYAGVPSIFDAAIYSPNSLSQ